MQSSEISQLRRKSVKFQLILLVVVLISFEFPSITHLSPFGHLGQSTPPQSMSVSLLSWLLLLQKRREGAEEGETEGFEEGRKDGVEVGETDGTEEGKDVGRAVGGVDGAEEGEDDGLWEGASTQIFSTS